MKKLLFIIAVAFTALFFSCSEDENSTPDNALPIKGLELPQSDNNNPISAGKEITIKGEGFNSSSEIWFEPVTKAVSQGIKAEIKKVDNIGITIVTPEIYGGQNVTLKQSDKTYSLGTMVFANIAVKKRIIKRDYPTRHVLEYSYDAQGRLKQTIFKYDDGSSVENNWIYNTQNQLAQTTEFNIDKAGNKTKQFDNTFVYKTDSIIVESVRFDMPENISDTLTLNKEGRIIKLEQLGWYLATYEYDSKGNLTKYYNNEKEVNVDCKYDDKKSYLSNQGLPIWYWVYNALDDFEGYAGPNNMVEEVQDGKLRRSYKFDYDSDGYPTVAYDKVTNEELIKFTYEIIK